MSTLVPKKSRDDVYRFLFTEGVLACPKFHRNKWHAQVGGKRVDVPVVQVMYLMRQLKSRNLIKEQFAWRHFYWFLNDEGVAFLRKYLHLADNVVPNTQRKPDKEENFERRPAREGDGEGRGRGRGGRGGRGRGDGSGRGGRGGRGGFRDREGGADGEGRGRGRGGRGGFRSDRRDYHSDPAAGTTGAGDSSNAAGAGDQPIERPRGRGRGRGAPTTGSE